MKPVSFPRSMRGLAAALLIAGTAGTAAQTIPPATSPDAVAPGSGPAPAATSPGTSPTPSRSSSPKSVDPNSNPGAPPVQGTTRASPAAPPVPAPRAISPGNAPSPETSVVRPAQSPSDTPLPDATVGPSTDGQVLVPQRATGSDARIGRRGTPAPKPTDRLAPGPRVVPDLAPATPAPAAAVKPTTQP